MTHPTDPVAAMRAECANAVRRRASSLHLSKQHNAALEAAKCADLIETLPLPACATGDDAAHDERARRCPWCELGGSEGRRWVGNGGTYYHHGRDGFDAACTATPAPSRPADDAGDAVRVARERFIEAYRAYMKSGCRAKELVAFRDAEDALLAAESAQRSAGESSR